MDDAAPTDRPWLGPLAGGLVVAVMVVILRAMGRVWWCSCGSPVPWAWDTWSNHNSQHIVDPYAASHVLHGVLFYGILRAALGTDREQIRLVLSAALEAVWEVAENTPMMIDRYRETASLDYAGDSIANSIADVGFCVLGYLVARRLPVWGSVAFFVAVELILVLWIRDNLTLNILMLIHPIEAVKTWQMGG